MPPIPAEGSEERIRREFLFSLPWLVAAIGLLLLPVSVQQLVSSGLRASALRPFIEVQRGIQRSQLRAAEFDILQARYDSLSALMISQAPLVRENQNLRSLLELKGRTGPTFVASSALRPGTRGSESIFLLDVGSEHGVSVNNPVVAAGGLVGVVREVGPRTSLAMDWTHPDFAVSVMTPDGEIFGVVETRKGSFREEDRLILNGIPFYSELLPGSILLTSGQGAVYPRGIRMGTVLSLAEAEAGWRRGYWVEPAVQMGSVTHVLVLTGPEGLPNAELTYLWLPPELELEPDTLTVMDPQAPPVLESGSNGVPR